jgi:hypothetical protein
MPSFAAGEGGWRVLAEAVSLDGGALLVVLVIGLVFLAAIVVVIVEGFVLAPKADGWQRSHWKG